MGKIRKEEAMATPVSSLIDVVFLLIIFFIVTASADEDIIDTTIDLAQAKNVPAVEKKDPRTITINMDEKGNMNIATIPQSHLAIEQELKRSREKLGNDLPIVIRADAETLFMHIDRLNATVGKSGLYRVRYSALSDK
ncbi:MAG: ExbD/TolR family protein [Lentisphaeria bacterium]